LNLCSSQSQTENAPTAPIGGAFRTTRGRLEQRPISAMTRAEQRAKVGYAGKPDLWRRSIDAEATNDGIEPTADETQTKVAW